jgi:protein SCO1/2
MMKRFSMIATICLLTAIQAIASEHHQMQGMLLSVDAKQGLVTVSCDAIPGYMEAMVMPFSVRNVESFHHIHPGTVVRFTMVEEEHKIYAEHMETVDVTNHESEPTEAARLTFLHNALNRDAASTAVSLGQQVPDFELKDQSQATTHLSQFKGKVVALTFTYSRCPNPNYCFRLSNNLAQLSRRFRAYTGRDLVLVTIVIDPDNDQGKALAHYADTWRADPSAWRFLTGPLPQVQKAAQLFGMNFWNDEGLLIHSFHTVLIDREGRLAANLEGNQFTADQLGDLVEAVLLRRPSDVRSAGVGREAH